MSKLIKGIFSLIVIVVAAVVIFFIVKVVRPTFKGGLKGMKAFKKDFLTKKAEEMKAKVKDVMSKDEATSEVVDV